MRENVRNRVIVADAEKARIKLEAMKKYRKYPPMLQKPFESLHVITNMPIHIREDDYLVGDMGNKGWGAANGMMWLMADIENTWPIEEDGLHHAPDEDPTYSHQKLAISPEDLKALREIAAEQVTLTGGWFAEEWLPDGALDFFKLQASDYGKIGGFPTHLPPGHLTPGFQNILKKGYGAIRKQAQDWLDAHEGNIMGDNMGKYMFYKAATVACDGAITLTRRYADLAREMATVAKTPERKAELEKMAEGLDWIAENPARTFWEALQQVMLYNVFLKVDNDPGVTSLGRFDQYTWPYLQKDLKEGRITMDEAQELVDAFFLKINTFYGGGFGKTTQTAGIGHLGQHTTIGGLIPETGEDATNPVSYMVLEAMARLDLHEPTVSLRVNRNTPKEIWECAMATSMRVGGLPLLQNDEVIVPAIVKELGFTIEDARNFAFIGCQEITGSGNDYPAPNGSAMGHSGIYWAIALLMAINNGVNPMNGAAVPEKLRSGYLYDMKSMEEVKAAFEKIATWMLTWSASLNNYTEHEYPRLFPFPNLSISTEGCMESGKDVSEGGAKYNSYGGTATGLATTADSLTAIKYMVFDKKLCTARELYDAVMADWEGYEPLRQRILTEVPHYGNGDPYADMEMKYLLDLYYNISRNFSTHRCKVYKCGTFGASDHVVQGEITWATPDGRKSGTPIADACSPAQGRDVNGPTAVFASATTFDHSRFMDGMALNIKIHPTSLRGQDGVNKLIDMTKTYFDEGGMEVQYNVVDAETLKKAQEKPDDFQNLVVRIAGFSAYFVDMTPAMQADIISRAEHRI
jgi:formate C-acetyltransferase